MEDAMRPKQQVPLTVQQVKAERKWPKADLERLAEQKQASPQEVNMIPRGGEPASQAQLDQEDKLQGQPVCSRCVDEKIAKAVGPQKQPLPPQLLAMKDMLNWYRWQEVLQHRAMQLVNEEVRQREEDTAGLSYQRGYQACQQEQATRKVGAIKKDDPAACVQQAFQDLTRFGSAWVGMDLAGQPEPSLSSQVHAFKDKAEKEAVRQQVERRLHGLGGEAGQQIRPASAVAQEVNCQHNQLDELGEALERLEDRLRSVLEVGVATTGVGQAFASEPAGAPLLANLRTVSARMEMLRVRLADLQGRLIL